VRAATIEVELYLMTSGLMRCSSAAGKMLVNLILWIILGGVAGWIASMIMNRDAQMGAVANIIVGIVGAIVGGFLFNLVGLAGDTGFNLWTLLVAIIGAVALLFLVGVVQRA
jgi:uncharacterized membrane protein YeaQ/YmgE (transglycosylase-associated protein family)